MFTKIKHSFLGNSFTLVSIVIIIYIVVSLGQWYTSVVTKEIDGIAKNQMEETISQLELLLEKIVEESENDLSLLADCVASADVTYDTAVSFFHSQSHAKKFNNLYYIRLDGQGISAQKIIYNFADNETFRQALSNDFVVSDPFISPENGKFVFDIAVPVKKDNKIVAVLLTGISMNDFHEIMIDMTRENGWAFLLNLRLNILYTTSDVHEALSVIPEEDIAEMGIKNVETVRSNLTDGKSGSFFYTTEGEKKVMVYTPINMTDWAVAVTIPIKYIAQELNGAVNHIHSVGIVILLILLALGLYIWFTKYSLLKSLEKAAYYDPLTDLPNLLKIKKEIELSFKNLNTEKYSILKFDIVHFKVINEMFGHNIGDTLLQAVKPACERVTADSSLTIARIGVDEFLLFAENELLSKIENNLDSYEAHYKELVPELKNHKLAFKYGKYEITQDDTDIDGIINKVNFAHKLAKEGQEGIVQRYDDVAKAQIMLEAELEDKMETALYNNEFEVYLQPKISLLENKLVGAEALIRWFNSSGEMIYPNTFIPLFEKNGFIIQLDHYVLGKVCLAMRSWLDQGKRCVPVSVNCSRLNLNNAHYINDVTEIVDSYNIPHQYIEIELTESSTVGSEEIIKKLFQELHARDFKISIDDFGSGYSSLSMLKNFNIDTVKMDKSFFNETSRTKRDDILISGVVQLTHDLGMYIVAEGIETSSQIERLKELNCDAVQGYFYSKPIPISEFEAKYIFSS